MQVYDAPLRDMRFVLHELFADDGFGGIKKFEEFTPDLLDAVLEEANKVAKDVLLPINASGDIEGCTYENGVVRTPKGFKEAYKTFCEGGWASLASDPEWGGQGLPESVNKLVEEMICATNVSFSLYPGLTHGATTSIEGHASEELKHAYLPKMVSGEWSGTMCLTESHCGTDLGLLRTKAEAQADGSYKITGSKIFISAGDHDLTDNVVHLVLARLSDAPAGVKGISLFLVPKFLPKDDGTPGPSNGVSVAGIEHKMGMKASATCQMNFDDATGWLVGQPNKGMAAMFTMMNTERVSVGVQGLGINEIAYQSAVAYAKERLQGRSLSGAKRPDLPADPIIVHPDVRRMLMTMRVYAEGCRALGQWCARALDAEKHSDDPEVKQRAGDFVALMTPVVKAIFTDFGFDAANLAVQTYGGHGYIREHGVEQFARDSPDRDDLRGHQRRPGARPRRPQAARQYGPQPAPLLPRGLQSLRGDGEASRTRRSKAYDRRPAAGVRRAPALDRDDRAEGHEGSRGSGRCRDRLPAPDGAGRDRLLLPQGLEDRSRQARRGRGR